MSEPHDVKLPLAGMTVKVVPRGQLKCGKAVKRVCRLPSGQPLPPPKAEMDFSRGRQTVYPPLGNLRYGDCYMVAPVHQAQTWSALTGEEWKPSEAEVIAAYLRLAGGDNGLSDDQVYPYWKNGLLGTDHRILDYAVLPDGQPNLYAQWMDICCGLTMTLAIPDRWFAVARPGAVWDAKSGDRPNQANGHAVHWSGRKGGWLLETWGFPLPVTITDAGLSVCDPEVIAVVSLDHFDQNGYTPTGYSYAEVADWWQQATGATLPPSPFGPAPPPPPPPPTGGLVLHLPAGIPCSIDGLAAALGMNPATDEACRASYGLTWQQLIALLIAILQALNQQSARKPR